MVDIETELIPERLMERASEQLRVLGQPVRLRLVELLSRGPSTPQELSDTLGLSQQNVSKHLLTLYRAGVVSRRPDSPYVFYALVDDTAAGILRMTVESVSDRLRDLANLASDRPAMDGSDANKGLDREQ